jgi:hypothetical protein
MMSIIGAQRRHRRRSRQHRAARPRITLSG